MNIDHILQSTQSSLDTTIHKTFNLHTLLVFIIALAVAYAISQVLAFIIVRLARAIGHYGDLARSPENTLRLRRLETYLSVGVALMRFMLFIIALLVAWRLTHHTTGTITIIGASTVFVVLAGATVQPLLRDVTSGSLMIAEGWYNVGDFITIDPMVGDAGVVERMNLRSTRIRKINGEIMWIHNQYIQHVSVSPKGIRTLAIDLFVRDLAKGKELVSHLKQIITVGPTMLVKPLTIGYTQKLGDHMHQITIIGQTAPGREWLVEKFAVDILKERDLEINGEQHPTILYEPLTRYADPMAERRFRRAVRIKREAAKGQSKLAKFALATQQRYQQKREQQKQKH